MPNDMSDPTLDKAPAPAPTAPDILGPVPAGGNAPLVAPNAAPAAPPAPVVNPAAVAQVQNDSKWGKLAQFVLGSRTEYAADETGKIVPTQVKNTPGELFRHILGGVLMGAAAGAKHPEAGWLGGAGLGGEAVIEDNRTQDAKRRTDAEKNVVLQQQQQRVQMEKQRMTLEEQQLAQRKIEFASSMAHITKEESLHERDANLRDMEFNSRENTQSNQTFQWLHDNGASIARDVPNNGVMGNGEKLEQLAVENPAIRQAPQGYQRTFQKKMDLSGLNYSLKDGYTDKEGKPVDLKTRTTITVWDVPDSVSKQVVNVDNKAAAKMFPDILGGGVLPKEGSRPYTVQELSDLRVKQSTMNRQANEEQRKQRHDMAGMAIAEINSSRRALAERIKSSRDISGVVPPEAMKKFEAEDKDLTNQFRTVMSGIEPEFKNWWKMEPVDTKGVGQPYSIGKVQEDVSKKVGWTEVKSQNLIVVVDPKTGVWQAVPAAQEATATRNGLIRIPTPGETELPTPPATKVMKASER